MCLREGAGDERSREQGRVQMTAGNSKTTHNVGIVIVSHSPDVARGAADMVRQMVGNDVPLAWCGGAPGGGLGTQVGGILPGIKPAWAESLVAGMVDFRFADNELGRGV